MSTFKGKQVWMIWDGATYHKSEEVKEYLRAINEGLEEKEWKLHLMEFEKNAPDQNPVEDIWLKGKNFLRKHFYEFTSFAKVRKAFKEYLDENVFNFHKYDWYF